MTDKEAALYFRHQELTCLLGLAKYAYTDSLKISPNHCRASSASCCGKNYTSYPHHRTLWEPGNIRRGALTSFASNTADCTLLQSEQWDDQHSPVKDKRKETNERTKRKSTDTYPSSSFKDQQQLLQSSKEKALHLQAAECLS